MTKNHDGHIQECFFPTRPHVGVAPGSLATECPIKGISDISMLKASPKIRRMLCKTQVTFAALGTLQSSETVCVRGERAPFIQQADDRSRGRTQSILSTSQVIK